MPNVYTDSIQLVAPVKVEVFFSYSYLLALQSAPFYVVTSTCLRYN